LDNIIDYGIKTNYSQGTCESMQRAIKLCLVIFSTLCLALTSAGCIHFDFGDPFRSEEPEPTEYHLMHKEDFPISHYFDFSQNLDPKHSETNPIVVKKGTQWVNVTIEVMLNDFSIINDTPIGNDSLVERYVHVIIQDPEGEEYYNTRFLESAEVKRSISLPTKGPWVVKVEALGFGYQEIRDYYIINAVAFEPI
jgi:hypothetical protein